MDRNRAKAKVSTVPHKQDLKKGKQKDGKIKPTRRRLNRHIRKSPEMKRLTTTDGFWSTPQNVRASRSSSTTSLLEQTGTNKGKITPSLASKGSQKTELSSVDRKTPKRKRDSSKDLSSEPCPASKCTNELKRLETTEGFWSPGITDTSTATTPSSELGKDLDKGKDPTAMRAYSVSMSELRRLQTTEGFWSPSYTDPSPRQNSRDPSPSSTCSSMDKVARRTSGKQSSEKTKSEEDQKSEDTEDVKDSISLKKTRSSVSVVGSDSNKHPPPAKSKSGTDAKQLSSSGSKNEPPLKRSKVDEKKKKDSAMTLKNGKTPSENANKPACTTKRTKVSASAVLKGRLAISDLLRKGELKRLNTTDGFWSPTPQISVVLSRSRQNRTIRSQSVKPQNQLLEHRKKKLKHLKLNSRTHSRRFPTRQLEKTSIVQEAINDPKQMATSNQEKTTSNKESRKRPKHFVYGAKRKKFRRLKKIPPSQAVSESSNASSSSLSAEQSGEDEDGHSSSFVERFSLAVQYTVASSVAPKPTKTWQRGRKKAVTKESRSPEKPVIPRRSRENDLNRSLDVVMECEESATKSQTKASDVNATLVKKGLSKSGKRRPNEARNIETTEPKKRESYKRGSRESFQAGNRGSVSKQKGSFTRGKRGSFARGTRGSFTGTRGSFTGTRGSFTGGERGSFNGGERGSFTGKKRGAFTRGKTGSSVSVSSETMKEVAAEPKAKEVTGAKRKGSIKQESQVSPGPSNPRPRGRPKKKVDTSVSSRSRAAAESHSNIFSIMGLEIISDVKGLETTDSVKIESQNIISPELHCETNKAVWPKAEAECEKKGGDDKKEGAPPSVDADEMKMLDAKMSRAAVSETVSQVCDTSSNSKDVHIVDAAALVKGELSTSVHNDFESLTSNNKDDIPVADAVESLGSVYSGKEVPVKECSEDQTLMDVDLTGDMNTKDAMNDTDMQIKEGIEKISSQEDYVKNVVTEDQDSKKDSRDDREESKGDTSIHRKSTVETTAEEAVCKSFEESPEMISVKGAASTSSVLQVCASSFDEEKENVIDDNMTECLVHNVEEKKTLTDVNVETDNKNDAETYNKNDAEIDDKNDAETDDKNDAEIDDKNDAETDDKNDAEIDDKNDAEIDDKNDAEIDDKNDAEIDDKNDAEIDDKNDAEIDDKNDAETDNKNDAGQASSTVVDCYVEKDTRHDHQVSGKESQEGTDCSENSSLTPVDNSHEHKNNNTDDPVDSSQQLTDTKIDLKTPLSDTKDLPVLLPTESSVPDHIMEDNQSLESESVEIPELPRQPLNSEYKDVSGVQADEEKVKFNEESQVPLDNSADKTSSLLQTLVHPDERQTDGSSSVIGVSSSEDEVPQRLPSDQCQEEKVDGESSEEKTGQPATDSLSSTMAGDMTTAQNVPEEGQSAVDSSSPPATAYETVKETRKSYPTRFQQDHVDRHQGLPLDSDPVSTHKGNSIQRQLFAPAPDPLRKVRRRRYNLWRRGVVKKAKNLSTQSRRPQCASDIPGVEGGQSQVHSKGRRPSSGLKKKHLQPHSNSIAELAMQASKIIQISPDNDKPKRLMKALKRLRTDANLANASIDDKNLQTRARKGLFPVTCPGPSKRRKLMTPGNTATISESANHLNEGSAFPFSGNLSQIEISKEDASKQEERSLPKLSPLGLNLNKPDIALPIDTTPPVLTPQKPIDHFLAFGIMAASPEDEVVNESVDDTDFHLYLSGASDEEEAAAENQNLASGSVLSGSSKVNQGKSLHTSVVVPTSLETPPPPILCEISTATDEGAPASATPVARISKMKGKRGRPPGIPVSRKDMFIQPSKTARKSIPSVHAASASPLRTFEFRKKSTRSPLEMLEMKRKQEEAIYDLEMERIEARKIIRREKRFARVPTEPFAEDELIDYVDMKPCSVVLSDFVKKLNLDQTVSKLYDNLPSSPYNLQYQDDLADEDWCADLEDVGDEDEDEDVEKKDGQRRPYIPRLKLKRVPKKGKSNHATPMPRNLVAEMKSPEQEPLKIVIKSETSSDVEEPSKCLAADPQASSVYENNYLEFLKQRSLKNAPPPLKHANNETSPLPSAPIGNTDKASGNPRSSNNDSNILTAACVQNALTALETIAPVLGANSEPSSKLDALDKTDTSLNDSGQTLSADESAMVKVATEDTCPPLPEAADLGPEEEEDLLILDLTGHDCNQDGPLVLTPVEQTAVSDSSPLCDGSERKVPNIPADTSVSVPQKNQATGDNCDNVDDKMQRSSTVARDMSTENGQPIERNLKEIVMAANSETKATNDQLETATDNAINVGTECEHPAIVMDEPILLPRKTSVDSKQEAANNEIPTPVTQAQSYSNNNNNVVKPCTAPTSVDSSSPVHSTSQDPSEESRKLKTIPLNYKQMSGSYKCKRCGFTAVSKLSIESHIYSHIPDVHFQCVNCQSEFSSMMAIFNHFRNSHASSEIEFYASCQVDESNFYTVSTEKEESVTSQMAVGVDGQSPPFIISLVVSGAARSVRASSTSRRFVCTHCGFSTNVKEYVQQHVSDLHASQPVYTCTLCKDSVGLSESKIKEHSASVHPSRQRPYVKLPDFYDADQLAMVEKNGNSEECGGNVLRVSTLFSGDKSPREGTPVGHQLKAKDYLYLQEGWKGKTSAEADSTTAPDCSDETLDGGRVAENETSQDSSKKDEGSSSEANSSSSKANSSSSKAVNESPETLPAPPRVEDSDVSELKIAQVVSLSGMCQSLEDDPITNTVVPSPQTTCEELNVNPETLVDKAATEVSMSTTSTPVTATSSTPPSMSSSGPAEMKIPPTSVLSSKESDNTATTISISERDTVTLISNSGQTTSTLSPTVSMVTISSCVPPSTSSSSPSTVPEATMSEVSPPSLDLEMTTTSSSKSESTSSQSSTKLSSAKAPSSDTSHKQDQKSTEAENISTMPTDSSSLQSTPSSSPSLPSSGGLPLSYQCKACKVHTPYLLMMVRHLKSRHPKILCFSCPYCKSTLSFNTQKQLRHHVRAMHPEKVDRNEMSLSEEAKKFVEAMVLPKSSQCTRVGNRLILEEDIHTCTICTLRMTSLSSVYDHLNEKHADLFEFVCPSCQSFKNKSLQVVSDHCMADHHSELDKDKVHVSVPKYLFTVLSCISKQGKYTEKVLLSPPTTAPSKDAPNSSKSGEAGVSAKGDRPTADSQPVRPQTAPTKEVCTVNTGGQPTGAAEAPVPPRAHCIPPSTMSVAPGIPLNILMGQTPMVAIPIVNPTTNAATARSMVAISSSLFDTTSLSVPQPPRSAPVPVEPLLPTAIPQKGSQVPAQQNAARLYSLPVLNVPTIRPRPASVRQQPPAPGARPSGRETTNPRAPSTPSAGHSTPASLDQLPEDEPNPDAFKIFNLRPAGMTPPVMSSPAPVSQGTPSVFPPVTSAVSLPSGYIPGPMAGFPAAMVIPPSLIHSAFPFAVAGVPNPARSMGNSQGKYPNQGFQPLVSIPGQLPSHLQNLAKVTQQRPMFVGQQQRQQMAAQHIPGSTNASLHRPSPSMSQSSRYPQNVPTIVQQYLRPAPAEDLGAARRHSSPVPSSSSASSSSPFVSPHPGGASPYPMSSSSSSSSNPLKKGRKSSTLYTCPYCANSPHFKPLELASHIPHAHPGRQIHFQKAT